MGSTDQRSTRGGGAVEPVERWSPAACSPAARQRDTRHAAHSGGRSTKAGHFDGAEWTSSTALTAMASAPSYVAWPPMKPLACTKMHPDNPAAASSAPSRSPAHAAGSGCLEVKEPSEHGTAMMRQSPRVSAKSTYQTLRARGEGAGAMRRRAGGREGGAGARTGGGGRAARQE